MNVNNTIYPNTILWVHVYVSWDLNPLQNEVWHRMIMVLAFTRRKNTNLNIVHTRNMSIPLYIIWLLIEYVICNININILKLQNYWMKNSLIFPQVALTHIWQRRWSCREHGLSSFKWVWTRSANAYKTIMNCVLFTFIATTCINTALSFNDSALLMFSTPHYITKCDCSY